VERELRSGGKVSSTVGRRFLAGEMQKQILGNLRECADTVVRTIFDAQVCLLCLRAHPHSRPRDWLRISESLFAARRAHSPRRSPPSPQAARL